MTSSWNIGAWRRVAVYGLGLSGRAAARLLRARGIEVVAFDGRPAAALDLGELAVDDGVELRLGREPQDLEGASFDALVVSPGVPADRPLLAAARQRAVPTLAEVELAFALLEGTVVGITGSNGKSTTTALTGALLRQAGHAVEVCGNIGEPLSDRVTGPPGRIFVVELSSFQLEGVHDFRPRAAALLNLSPDHLDRHGDFAGYRRAKAMLFARQETSDVAVLNAEDPPVATLPVPGRRRFFSRLKAVEDGCYTSGEKVVETAPGEAPIDLFRTKDLRLTGEHNLENAMAAALLARAFDTPPAAIAAGLRGFEGLPHRMQKVAERDGVIWYDDSKGTNPGATLRSLAGFADHSVHLILGGRNKGTDLGVLASTVAAKARRVYLIGETAAELAGLLGSSVPVERSGTLEEAVAAVARAVTTGETVLLSPACASFDQFTSFAERGEAFTRLVASVLERRDGHGA